MDNQFPWQDSTVAMASVARIVLDGGQAVEPGVVDESKPVDLESFGQFLLAQVNAQMDNEIAVIRSKSDTSINTFSRQVLKELRKQSEETAKLAEQVAEKRQETERAHLQLWWRSGIGQIRGAPRSHSRLKSLQSR